MRLVEVVKVWEYACFLRKYENYIHQTNHGVFYGYSKDGLVSSRY